jgi:protein-S-isoprenylcysteine O-methyltransferase Ste14
MNAAQKSKLYDLAAATPMVALLSFEIGWALLLILQTPGTIGSALTICSKIADVVFSCLLILLFAVRRPPVRKAHGLLPRVAAIVGLLLPFIVLGLPRANLTLSMTIFSSAIVLAGTIASIFITCWLGRSFSILPQARALVTEGPYRFVRHPLYLAEFIILFGGLWEFEQPWSFFVMAAVIGVQLPRIHFEEQVLMEAFPSYREYASRTARLLPGLY